MKRIRPKADGAPYQLALEHYFHGFYATSLAQSDRKIGIVRAKNSRTRLPFINGKELRQKEPLTFTDTHKRI